MPKKKCGCDDTDELPYICDFHALDWQYETPEEAADRIVAKCFEDLRKPKAE